MKILIAAIMLSLTGFVSHTLNAQDAIVGNGQMVKQQRALGSFDKLTVRVGIRLRITTGNAKEAELEGESNVLEQVVTEVKNGELTVMFNQNKQFRNTKGVTVTIHVAKLDKILVSTGCSVSSDLPILADNLTATVETGSNLTTSMTTKKLKLTVKEGSKATLSGTATDATIQLSGAGKLEGDKLTIDRSDIHIDGASHASIHVTETLSASADGVSTINYTGNPKVTSQEATGLSKIRRKG